MGLRRIWQLLKAATAAWYNDNVPRLGAALSFYTLFALSPLFVIVVFVASLWFDQAAVRAALMDEVNNLIGQTGGKAIESALTAAAPHSQGWLASSVAVVTLLITATGVFVELQSDLNFIWGVEEKPGQGLWSFLRGRLLSLAMVLGIGFLLLVSLVVSTALTAAGKYLQGLAPRLEVVWLPVNAAVDFAVITVLFAMVFKILPDVKIRWREVWIGAVITALLFTAGKFGLGFYLGRSSTISTYGAAGSLVLVLLWVYYSAQILFFGVELTQVYANRFGRRLEPKANARWMAGRERRKGERKTKNEA